MLFCSTNLYKNILNSINYIKVNISCFGLNNIVTKQNKRKMNKIFDFQRKKNIILLSIRNTERQNYILNYKIMNNLEKLSHRLGVRFLQSRIDKRLFVANNTTFRDHIISEFKKINLKQNEIFCFEHNDFRIIRLNSYNFKKIVW